MQLLYLIVGVAGLWMGAGLTIGGALRLAKQHSLSDFFVGLAILSVGSDLPELIIAIDSGIKNNLGGNVSGIVVGTSIGSVAGQLGFVPGMALTAFIVVSQHGHDPYPRSPLNFMAKDPKPNSFMCSRPIWPSLSSWLIIRCQPDKTLTKYVVQYIRISGNMALMLPILPEPFRRSPSFTY